MGGQQSENHIKINLFEIFNLYIYIYIYIWSVGRVLSDIKPCRLFDANYYLYTYIKYI